MFPSYMLQGGSSSLLQGGGSGGSIQGSSPTIQGSSPNLQPTVNPQNGQNLSLGGGAAPQGLVNTAPAVDPAAVALLRLPPHKPLKYAPSVVKLLISQTLLKTSSTAVTV